MLKRLKSLICLFLVTVMIFGSISITTVNVSAADDTMTKLTALIKNSLTESTGIIQAKTTLTV